MKKKSLLAIPEGKSWFYVKENLSPPLVCHLLFPVEFEAEINESVALMARNGSPEWKGGPNGPRESQWQTVVTCCRGRKGMEAKEN